jgi:hypothetical protein
MGGKGGSPSFRISLFCLTPLLIRLTPPHVRRVDVHDYLSIASHVVLQIIFLAALFIKLHGDITTHASAKLAAAVLDFDSVNSIVRLPEPNLSCNLG